MHIVFATTEFVTEKSYDGGLANYLDKASRILSEHGHQVTIVVFSDDDKIIEYQKNIRVVRVVPGTSEIKFILKHIKNETFVRALSYCWNSYKINRKIREIHKENKIDIVQYCHLSALGLFRIKKIPSVVRMSSFGPLEHLIWAADFTTTGNTLNVDLLDKLDITAMKRADSVFAPSVLTAKIVKRATGLNVKVLETPTMGINMTELKQLPDSLAGKRYFLFFGTMCNKKGLKMLVNSIYRILEQNPQFCFVFVGRDYGVSMKEGLKSPVIKQLREKAGVHSDRIIYLQQIKDRQLLNSVIYHAELCVLPHRPDNLPNTCIEAMELGQIVISTYKSGVSQLIKDGHNGFLVEQNNSEALADKIREVLQLPYEEKRRISENAKKRTEKMRPERFYQYMIQYYKEVICNHDGKNGKIVFEILDIVLGLEIIMSFIKRFRSKKTNEKSGKSKMAVYYQLMNKWMKLHEEKKFISDYMERHGFETIAIYGMGDIGKHLRKELENSKTRVLYAINKEVTYSVIDMDTYSPESEMPPVDAVIVTPVMEYEDICKVLEGKVSCPILPITDVINELAEYKA